MLAVFAKADDPLSGGRNIPGGCFSHARLRIAPVSQVVATWIPKASGIAYASKLRGDGAVTLCSFGDGATSKGDFHEGVNFAAVHRLPVVFVCENNGYAISVPLRLQVGGSAIAERAAGYGIAGVAVDGTDVPACYQAAKEAVARARGGQGPTLIEARIWRLNAHTSEDNQAKYRAAEEIEEAGRHDPLLRFEAWLEDRGWLSDEDARAVREDFGREAADAADWAETQPDPNPEDLTTNLYA
jgi:2-oxoisovalerate dehydrogenase E1 component alpha subunit